MKVMLNKPLLLISLFSLLMITSCKDEKEDSPAQINQVADNAYKGTFKIDGVSVSFTDGGNAAMIPSSAYIIKANTFDTVKPIGLDTIVKRTVTIHSRHAMSYSSRNSAQKLIILTDSVRYTTNQDTSFLLSGSDVVKGYREKSNFDIMRTPSWAFYDILDRSTYTLASNGSNGFRVIYVGEDGVIWRSNLGPQPNSTFSITVTNKSAFTDGLEYVNANVKFSCTVYNGTSSKVITDASMSGLFVNSK